MVHWWRICCQCRSHGFNPWSGTIPHAVEQLHLCAVNYWSCALEPVLRNKRSLCMCTATRESLHAATKTQYSQKLIKKWNFRKNKVASELSLSATGGHSGKVAVCRPGRKLLPGVQSAGSLILGLPRLQYCENIFLSFKLQPVVFSPGRLRGFSFADAEFRPWIRKAHCS